jgi:hypothetical protein
MAKAINNPVAERVEIETTEAWRITGIPTARSPPHISHA